MRQIALLVLLPFAVSAQTATREEPSTIEGRVINLAAGDPVGKASIRLARTGAMEPFDNWTNSYAASSDSAGKFAIGNIEPGKYRLRATRNGFLALEYGARGRQRSGTVLDFSNPQQLKDIEIRLTPQGVIAGRVLDVEGEPLERAQVQILRSKYVNGKKVLATIRTIFTNDLGEYRCPRLSPGRYYVYAENVEDGLPPASDAREEYVPVYYPASTDAAGAVALDVAAGAEVRAADTMLRKARTATVKGRVVVELPSVSGIPTVRFTPQIGHDNSGAESYRSYPAKVAASGRFEIRTLTAGTYHVWAEIGDGKIGRISAPINLEVAGANVDDIVLRIDDGLSISNSSGGSWRSSGLVQSKK